MPLASLEEKENSDQVDVMGHLTTQEIHIS